MENEPVLMLDGSPHGPGHCDCEYACQRCGGLMHRETVYGPSFIYECQACGFDDPDERALRTLQGGRR